MTRGPGGGRGLLPALSTFVGRSAEVDEVVGLLGRYRLVTVTGPGGVGKTRLAAEVAARVAGRFPDGVSAGGAGQRPGSGAGARHGGRRAGVRQAGGGPVLEWWRGC